MNCETQYRILLPEKPLEAEEDLHGENDRSLLGMSGIQIIDYGSIVN